MNDRRPSSTASRAFPAALLQAMQIANHVVEPRFGPLEQPVPPCCQEQKREARTDGRAREHFRKLRLLIHTNLLLDDPPALDELHQQRNDRKNEQHVDEAAERVGADYTEHPQHHKNEKNCPEHTHPPKKVNCVFKKHGVCQLAPPPDTVMARQNRSMGAEAYRTATPLYVLMSSVVTVKGALGSLTGGSCTGTGGGSSVGVSGASSAGSRSRGSEFGLSGVFLHSGMHSVVHD